jgi:hypothetical protein
MIYVARSNRGLIGSAVLLLIVLMVAIFFGLLAITANPILVSLGAGLLLGILLLAKPSWNVWIILAGGLLVVGVLPIWVDSFASKVVWVISLFGFVLLLSSFFRVVSVPEAVRGTPAFVWLALAFLVYALLNSLAQWSSFFEFASSFKRYFQAIGLLFALAWLSFTERQVLLWRAFIIIVALVQLPWALYELLELVPIREGLQHTYGLVPIDVVAGTFGASMYSGGANANMATFLIIILAFFLAHRREKLLGLGNYLLLLLFVLTPLFMGETKVVVILLPLMFFVLYRSEMIARPHHALLALGICALLTAAVGYTYMGHTNFQSLDGWIANTLQYNVYEKGYGGKELNRTSVLTFWAEQQGGHDPISAVFGNGLGAAHEVTRGNLALRYYGYGIGLTAISSLLWEQGSVGVALYLSILIFAWRSADSIRHGAIHGWMRADAAAIQSAVPLFVFYLFYRSALLESLPFQIFFYSLLGYLAWLYRLHNSCVNTKV